MIFLWGERDVVGYNLQNQELEFHIQNIGLKADPISQTVLSQQYKYLITGQNSGFLKVWKLQKLNLQKRRKDTNGSYSNYEGNPKEKKMIHNFQGHTRKIVSIKIQQNPKLFWSASLDDSIRLWNLDLQNTFQNISLLSDTKFIAQQEHQMYIGTISHQNENIHSYYGQIKSFHKYFKNKQIHKNQGEIEQICFTLNNNSGICINNLENIQKLNDNQKPNISIYYPPPKSNQIINMLASPFEQNIIYLLLETGRICKYKQENNTGIIEDQQLSQQIKDSENNIMGINASIIKFLNIFPPNIDTQINEFKINQNKNQDETSLEAMNQKYFDQQLMCIGYQRGQIIFVKSNNWSKIYCRITYHREKITDIEAIYSKSKKTYLLISLCEELKFKVVHFQKNKIELIKQLEMEIQEPIQIKSFWKYLFTLSTKGNLNIFKLDENKDQLKTNLVQDGSDHEDKIVSLDIKQDVKIIITAGLDNKVKLWTFKKALLLQIKINYGLENACFITYQGDILVAHAGKLSVIKNKFLGFQKENETKLKKHIQEMNKIISEQSIEYDFYHLYTKKGQNEYKQINNHKQQKQQWLSTIIKQNNKQSKQINEKFDNLEQIEISLPKQIINNINKSKIDKQINKSQSQTPKFNKYQQELEKLKQLTSSTNNYNQSPIKKSPFKKNKIRSITENIEIDQDIDNVSLKSSQYKDRDRGVSLFNKDELEKQRDYKFLKQTTALPQIVIQQQNKNSNLQKVIEQRFGYEKVLQGKPLSRRDITLKKIIENNLHKKQRMQQQQLQYINQTKNNTKLIFQNKTQALQTNQLSNIYQ